jgi:molybdopterin/thiamine biosynthesis adenylyltransferase
MATKEISDLLQQRFSEFGYWPYLEAELVGKVKMCSDVPRVVTDDQVGLPFCEHQPMFSLRQFLVAADEVLALRTFFANKSWQKETVIEHILANLSGLSPTFQSDVEKVLQQHFLLDDWLWFAERFLKESTPEKIVANASWICEPASRQYWLCVGPELLWLMSVSRCIGLIELEVLRQLRKTKIRVLGASVAAMTVDLLVALGCEDVVCVDPGMIEPSNVPRLPTEARNIGRSKVEVLTAQLLRRNPYGKFVGRQQKVENLEEFFADADLILEVVDDLKTKIVAQTSALKTRPNVPLIFIADVGMSPVVKVITTNTNQEVEMPFGRQWSAQQREQLLGVLKMDPSQPDFLRAMQRAAYLMLQENLPADHAVQFLLSCWGVMPFWSQTPVASRASAAMAASAILQNIKKTESTVKPELIHQLCRQFLGVANA